MDKLKLVKTTVFVITFLLVFGSMALLSLLYQKVRKTEAAPGHNISLGQPEGSTISEMELHNGNLYLLVKNGGQADRILIYRQDSTAPSLININ